MTKYNDFKSYIEENYRTEIIEAVEAYYNEPKDGFSPLAICDRKTENLKIKKMICHEDLGALIRIDAYVTVDINTMSLGSGKVPCFTQTKWFTIKISALLEDGLHDFKVIKVKDFQRIDFIKDDALDQFFVPYIYADDLEQIAEEFYDFHCDDCFFQDGWMLPVDFIMENMGVKCYHAPLESNEFGRMYFKNSSVNIYDPDAPRSGKIVQKKITPGTMLISDKNHFMKYFGSGLNTIAHELVHWEKHQKFFEVLSLLNADEVKLSCEVMPEVSPENLTGLKKAYWWAEWQANALASRICMPRKLFCSLLDQFFAEELDNPNQDYTICKGESFEQALIRVANCFGVSDYAAKVRALQVGYKQAEGTMIYIDAVFQPCYYFDSSSLEQYETYRIDYSGYNNLYESDSMFEQLIDAGRYVFTGAVVCLNDPVYVRKSKDEFNYFGYELTPYALEHVDECCLKFKRNYKAVNNTDDYYRLCYLSKEVDAATFIETKTIEYESNQDLFEMEKQLSIVDAEIERIFDIYESLPMTFHKTLDIHMNRLKKEDGSKMTNLELSMRTGLSDKYISELRKAPKNVSREAVYAICIGLHLHPLFSDDLIEKGCGGYSKDKNGMFAQYLIHKHFPESLLLINKKLQLKGYPLWGNPKNIFS